MRTENKVPAIRFKGFSGEWKEEEIGNVLTEVRRSIELMDNEFYQLVTVKRRNEGVVPRRLLKGSEILVKTYFVITAGDYLISKRQVVHGANGIVPDNLDNAVVSNEYLVVTDNENITANFWTLISKRNDMHKLFFISSYGVDIEKLVFDVSDWKKRTFIIPQLSEQKYIGGYFQQLDTLIDQHQKKHNKLLNLKKALLEKLFPKQGAIEPEIRFKGFSGEWEEKALGLIAEFNPKAELPATFEYVDLESVLGTEMISHRTVRKSVAPSRAQRLAQQGDVFYQTVRPYQKNNYLFEMMENNYVFSTGYAQMRPYDDGYFLLCLVQNTDFVKTVLDNCTGTSYPAINSTDLANILIRTPESAEQTKIGNLFKQLDTLITQHQTQIKKLNNIKQACLEKMFV